MSETAKHALKVAVGVIIALAVAIGIIVLSYLHFQTLEASTSTIGLIVEKLDSEHQEQ